MPTPRLAPALLAVALAACGPTPLAERVVGRYVLRTPPPPARPGITPAPPTLSVMDLRAGGSAVLTESRAGAVERSVGAFTTVGDTLYLTLTLESDRTAAPMSYVATLRGDTLVGRLHYIDVTSPFRMARER